MSLTRPKILLVEDNPADLFLVREALRYHGIQADLEAIDDGEKAIRLLQSLEANPGLPCPALLLLDLNIPRHGGVEVLSRLRGNARCADIPVIIMTSSDSPRDRQQTAGLSADCYFRKPTSFEAFLKLGELVSERLIVPPTAD